MATARLTRDERRERTRADLVRAARRIFLKRGFHAASLEEISSAAGYSTGAVYSNFASKDELFLAVLEQNSEQRVRDYAETVLDSQSFEEGIRIAAQVAWKGAVDNPNWIPLQVEFWTHASGNRKLRAAVSEQHERVMAAIAGLIDELARRHDVQFVIPTIEVARGSSALLRGMELERLLDPSRDGAAHFQEMWTAYALGLTRRKEKATP